MCSLVCYWNISCMHLYQSDFSVMKYIFVSARDLSLRAAGSELHALRSTAIVIVAIQGFEVATHPFGCRVMQRMLENCSEPQVDQVLTELLQFTELLIQVGALYTVVVVYGTPTHTAIYTSKKLQCTLWTIHLF